MAYIILEDVVKIFDNGKTAVNNASASIMEGEFVFILGKTGSGKSTLLRLIMRDESPTSGKIIVNGSDLALLNKKTLPFYRRSIGVINQQSKLLENKNVYDNVAFSMLVTEQSEKVIDESVPKALGVVGLRKKAFCLPSELSGGERFRVELARAIANNPKLILADEPTANLDSDQAWDMMQLFNEINRLGITLVIATHAWELVRIMKKKTFTMIDGRLFTTNVTNGRI